MLLRLLEVLIGLVFIYFLVSIFISGVNELLAQKLGRRGKFLRAGLKRLLPDEAVYRRVIHHPLVESLYRERAARGKIPSYIPPSDFSSALIDVVCARAAHMSQLPRNPGTLTFDDLHTALRVLHGYGSPLPTALLPILDRAENDLGKAIEGIERWFNGGMDRVSGWYKEAASTQLLILSLVVCVLGNVDSIEIAQALWRSPQLSAQLARQAEAAVASGQVADVKIEEVLRTPPSPEQMSNLRSALLKLEAGQLPIGFSCIGESSLTSEGSEIFAACLNNAKGLSTGKWGAKLIGWFLSAFAITLGAPFWFDLLMRLVNFRGAGPKPHVPEPARP